MTQPHSPPPPAFCASPVLRARKQILGSRTNIQCLEFEQVRASLLTFGEKLDLTMGGPPFALAGSTNGGKGRRDRPDRHRAPHADRPPHQRADLRELLAT